MWSHREITTKYSQARIQVLQHCGFSGDSNNRIENNTRLPDHGAAGALTTISGVQVIGHEPTMCVLSYEQLHIKD